jgi:hypothetical protein
MNAKTIQRPAALTNLMAKAKAKPVKLPAAMLDAKSTLRRECLGDMPIGELLALTGYGRAKEHAPHRLQRDTEARLAASRRSAHLRCFKAVPTPQHHISLVWFKGKLEVVDGNTRLTLWAGLTNEEVLVPASAVVTMYYPASETEYDLLYRCFDSNESRKTNQDNLFGMLRAVGIKPTSELLKKNKLVNAIRMVAGVGSTPESLFEGVRALVKPLQDLDSYGFAASPRQSYTTGVYTGLLSLLSQGYDRKMVAAFAKELKSCREVTGYASRNEAVQEFMLRYPECVSLASSVAVRKVRELTEKTYQAFEATYVAAKAPRRTAKVKVVKAKVA